MSNTGLTIKVPGKLMIAGEFAVLEPYHKLAVMAVNRYVYATIIDRERNLLTLENFNMNQLPWVYSDHRVKVQSQDERLEYVENAMTIALRYLTESNISPGTFMLSVKSELDDSSGLKYGLGSSAAVVTSVITAILERYLPQKPTANIIFRLAAITHVMTQGNGSGADVAASSYGGVLEYASFQAEWLQAEYEASQTITELVEKDWIYCSIKPIEIPNQVYICVGWTGKPASTKKLVQEIRKLKDSHDDLYQQFLVTSDKAVRDFHKGMKVQDIDLVIKGIKQNRVALKTVGNDAGVDIETPLLTRLCDLAEQYGGAAKPSGAGGGDCGIAFMPSLTQANKLMKAWEEEGIKVLDIDVSSHGAVKI